MVRLSYMYEVYAETWSTIAPRANTLQSDRLFCAEGKNHKEKLDCHLTVKLLNTNS